MSGFVFLMAIIRWSFNNIDLCYAPRFM